MLKKDKFSPLLFRLSLLQKLMQQWSWAMLACIPYARPVSIWCATQSKTALRDKGVLDPMVLFSIWGLFWKILAAQLHHFQDKSPAFCNGWETYPICLGFVLEKGEAVATLSQYTTRQLRDLTDCSKKPEMRVFSDLCLVIFKSGAASQCLDCNRL